MASDMYESTYSTALKMKAQVWKCADAIRLCFVLIPEDETFVHHYDEAAE